MSFEPLQQEEDWTFKFQNVTSGFTARLNAEKKQKEVKEQELREQEKEEVQLKQKFYNTIMEKCYSQLMCLPKNSYCTHILMYGLDKWEINLKIKLEDHHKIFALAFHQAFESLQTIGWSLTDLKCCDTPEKAGQHIQKSEYHISEWASYLRFVPDSIVWCLCAINKPSCK